MPGVNSLGYFSSPTWKPSGEGKREPREKFTAFKKPGMTSRPGHTGRMPASTFGGLNVGVESEFYICPTLAKGDLFKEKMTISQIVNLSRKTPVPGCPIMQHESPMKPSSDNRTDPLLGGMRKGLPAWEPAPMNDDATKRRDFETNPIKKNITCNPLKEGGGGLLIGGCLFGWNADADIERRPPVPEFIPQGEPRESLDEKLDLKPVKHEKAFNGMHKPKILTAIPDGSAFTEQMSDVYGSASVVGAQIPIKEEEKVYHTCAPQPGFKSGAGHAVKFFGYDGGKSGKTGTIAGYQYMHPACPAAKFHPYKEGEANPDPKSQFYGCCTCGNHNSWAAEATLESMCSRGAVAGKADGPSFMGGNSPVEHSNPQASIYMKNVMIEGKMACAGSLK